MGYILRGYRRCRGTLVQESTVSMRRRAQWACLNCGHSLLLVLVEPGRWEPCLDGLTRADRQELGIDEPQEREAEA